VKIDVGLLLLQDIKRRTKVIVRDTMSCGILKSMGLKSLSEMILRDSYIIVQESADGFVKLEEITTRTTKVSGDAKVISSLVLLLLAISKMQNGPII
jgi:polysaccharide pyruvyl transferase WcaK-like protein